MLGFPPVGAFPPVAARPPAGVLFDLAPIGTIMWIGVDSSVWYGRFGGIVDGVAFLTGARLYSNNGVPLDGIVNQVRIPLREVKYVVY